MFKREIILKTSFLFLLTFTMYSQLHAQNQLLSYEKIINIKWLNSNYDGCTSYYIFKKENNFFEYYNCAMNVLDTGKYEIVNDTLKVYEYHLISETPVPSGDMEKSKIRFQYNFILKDNALWQVFYADYKYDVKNYEIDSLRRYVKINKK